MKKVVIIGGGTAGWLTTLVVNKFWKDTEVTLIESSKIGVLGAGEGGTPNFGSILSLLDINHIEFFNETNSTIKNGLKLINWNGNGDITYHNFIGEEPNPFSKYKSYGYHFDAKRVANYFKKIALDRGIMWIDGEVSIINNTNETIHNLELKDGTIIDLDFIFDCSGFARLINGKIHNEEWISYSDFLLANKAFGFFLPQEKKYTIKDRTKTELTAMKCGWMFNIPLQHRHGCGYVFNDNYISVDDAKKEVESYLGYEIHIQKVFDFNPGTFKRSWIGNSVSIGLSYSFLEPLEATSLMTTIMQLKRLSDVNFDESYKDKFNKWCMQINEQNSMFIRFHYLCERNDTPFWIDAFNAPIPEKLKKMLDIDNSLIRKTDVELFNELNYDETSINELTFFVNNYSAIFKKNKKVIKKELI
jgi:tryptophan halogenase